MPVHKRRCWRCNTSYLAELRSCPSCRAEPDEPSLFGDVSRMLERQRNAHEAQFREAQARALATAERALERCGDAPPEELAQLKAAHEQLKRVSEDTLRRLEELRTGFHALRDDVDEQRDLSVLPAYDYSFGSGAMYLCAQATSSLEAWPKTDCDLIALRVDARNVVFQEYRYATRRYRTESRVVSRLPELHYPLKPIRCTPAVPLACIFFNPTNEPVTVSFEAFAVERRTGHPPADLYVDLEDDL